MEAAALLAAPFNSESAFRLVGAQPALGRVFSRAEEQPGAAGTGLMVRSFVALYEATGVVDGSVFSRSRCASAGATRRTKVANCAQAQPVFCGLARLAHGNAISVSVLTFLVCAALVVVAALAACFVSARHAAWIDPVSVLHST